MAKYQVIIGRGEEIDIVGVTMRVPAKIDTGAFRSSIHATDIKIVTVDGEKMLSFKILGHKCAPIARPILTDKFEAIAVRSSSGEVTNRYAVTFKIKIGPKVFNTSFSLFDRTPNVYPILIGREALNGRFLVDSAKGGVTKLKLSKQFGLPIGDAEDSEDD